jgi:hypothetical protein
MAILGFVIVVAGRAFSDSTGMRVRSQNMLASAEEAGRVSAILKDDISQMGAKSWGLLSANTHAFDTIASVHINFTANNDNADLSSYEIIRGENFDSFYFRKVHYDTSGVCGAVVEIEWHVTADSLLMRKCNSSKPSKCGGEFSEETECPANIEVEMARNVAEFRFFPSKRGIAGGTSLPSDTLFPDAGTNSFALIKGTQTTPAMASPPTGGDKIILSNFEKNADESGNSHANFYLAQQNEMFSCFPFTFEAGEEYAIDFDLICLNSACRSIDSGESFNSMVMFQPGSDHLSVGLRNTNMNGNSIDGIPDFLFYPPLDASANKIRHFEFSVPPPGPVNACIGITAAFYSTAASGRLEIENFKVYRKTDKVYHFDRDDLSYNPDDGQTKAAVKAFELSLGINKKGEINRTTTVIPVPNNGIATVSGGVQ